jgi:hypothetical protein
VYHDIENSSIPYPNHRRMPNIVVRGLYQVGYFFADFGPLFVNLFNVVYLNLRRLFGFFVGLLIEISTVIVLLATITFSIFHSIELLQRAGATGGMEYVGVAIFEVVFISSTALLTKTLMNGKMPDWASITGFIAGIIFVEVSNITGMADNWTGRIIGGSIPFMLVISEGVLAYRALSELDQRERKLNSLMKVIIQKIPNLTEQELLVAIEMVRKNGLSSYQKSTENMVENDQENATQNGSISDQNMTKKMVGGVVENVVKIEPEIVVENQPKNLGEHDENTNQELSENVPQNEPEIQPENEPNAESNQKNQEI